MSQVLLRDLRTDPSSACTDKLLGSQASSSGSDSSSSMESEFESNRPRKKLRRNRDAEFGLEDDCPDFEGLGNYVLEVAGASITAARELRDGDSDVVISWTGGR